MDARERWQTLQAHLASARALAQAGDVPAALQAVDRALEIDPDFLAAHSLKERLTTAPPAGGARTAVEPGVDAAQAEPGRAPRVLSAIAAIEAKALTRRARRRLAAADEAIRRRDFTIAAAAIDEARELGADPGDVLRIETALAEAASGRPRRGSVGKWIVAAATIAAGVFGAQYVDQQFAGSIPGHAIVAPPVAPAPEAVRGPIATTGVATPAITKEETIRLAPDKPRDVAPEAVPPLPTPTRPTPRAPVASAAPVEPIGPVEPPVRIAPPVQQLGTADLAPRATLPPPPPPPTVASAAPETMPSAELVAAPRTDTDERGVLDVLSRYRNAYEQLNARSARAVWPAVDERALARAFDGLAAQRLVFDNCDVNLRGDAATATCRGTARFTPKVGSSDPQVEPRTWSFTLRRNEGQWAIETARVAR